MFVLFMPDSCLIVIAREQISLRRLLSLLNAPICKTQVTRHDTMHLVTFTSH